MKQALGVKPLCTSFWLDSSYETVMFRPLGKDKPDFGPEFYFGGQIKYDGESVLLTFSPYFDPGEYITGNKRRWKQEINRIEKMVLAGYAGYEEWMHKASSN